MATWLGCHRRPFEWFAGVPSRLIIDNAKCAITRACAKDPLVQFAYAECAEGYGFKLADLNAQARTWLLDEASLRVHGTSAPSR